MVTKKTKIICSMLAGLVHHIGKDALLPMNNFYVYIISYLYKFDPSMTLFNSYFANALFIFTLTSSGLLGGRIDNRYGCHLAIAIGTVFILAGAGLFYVMTNLWTWFIGIFLMAMGLGMSGVITTKNICLYLPQKKGLISAVITSFGNLTMAICAFFGETLINPNNEKINQEGFFPFDVAKNILLYCNIVMYTFPACAVLTLLLMFRFKDELEIKEIKVAVRPSVLVTPQTEVSETVTEKLIDHNESNNEIGTIGTIGNGGINNTYNSNFEVGNAISQIEEKQNTNNNNVNKEDPVNNKGIPLAVPEPISHPQSNVNPIKPEHKQSNLMKVLVSKRIWILALLNYLSVFSLTSLLNTYRIIATLKKFDIDIPKYTNLISGVSVIIIGPLWGLLADKFSYKSLFITINVLIIVTGVSTYFTFDIPLLYSGLYICTRILLMGYIMIRVPYVMKIYSLKYFMEVNAIISVASGFNQIIVSVYNYYISDWAVKSKSNIPYLYAFCGAVCLNVAGIVIGYLYLSNEPFDYNKKNEKVNEGISDVSKIMDQSANDKTTSTT